MLENRYLQVEIGTDGTIASLYDKRYRRETLSGRGNQIWTYPDLPGKWEAWDIDASYLQEGTDRLATEYPNLVTAGTVRTGIQTTRTFEETSLKQIYWLWAGSPRLEIESWLTWEHRETLLRSLFPLNMRTSQAWFETAFGAVARPTHRNTSWDQARFEVPGLRFVDLSEAGYGVSLLNESKYGHSALGNEIGLSLARSPIYPDPYADHGDHHFTYALYPHIDDWRSGTLREAHDMNAPLAAVVLPGPGGSAPALRRLLSVDQPGIRLSTLKHAVDGESLILRLYEAHGGQGQATADLRALHLTKAELVNLLEGSQGVLELENGRLSFDFRPYQVISVRLTSGRT